MLRKINKHKQIKKDNFEITIVTLKNTKFTKLLIFYQRYHQKYTVEEISCKTEKQIKLREDEKLHCN